MKNEILDIRTFITIILVVISLAGHKWSTPRDQESDAQNLTFIHLNETLAIK